MEVKLDIIAIIISVIAILASVICAVIAFIQNYKINKINMKAGYYNKIFDSYLIEKIPMSYRYLIFKDNKLSDSDKISDVLSDLLKDILYFKCTDRKFYEVLKKSIEEIEDYILECGNRQFIQDEQGKVFENIQEKLENLYAIINNSYIGKFK